MPLLLLVLASLLLTTPAVAETRQATAAETLEITHSLAEQGHPKAQYMMGNYYSDGSGVSKNDARAFAWYLKAAEQGLPEAQFSLAVAYDLGEGTDQDLAKAAHWYQQAALNGQGAAAYNLAILYDEGLGVKRDSVLALAWMKIAVALQHGMAEPLVRQLEASQTDMQRMQAEQLTRELLQKIAP